MGCEVVASVFTPTGLNLKLIFLSQFVKRKDALRMGHFLPESSDFMTGKCGWLESQTAIFFLAMALAKLSERPPIQAKER